MSNRLYFGLATTFHDPAIAVVDSAGEVVFAEATERQLQDKRAITCPPDRKSTVTELFKEHLKGKTEIVVAMTWASQGTALTKVAAEIIELEAVLDRVSRDPSADGSWDESGILKALQMERPGSWRDMRLNTVTYASRAMLGMQVRSGQVISFLARDHRLPLPIYRSYDHHLTHAMTTAASSPFDDAAIAIIDGGGDVDSLAFYAYEDGTFRSLHNPTPNPNSASLGTFYGALTVGCGFDFAKGEEWKVMGLAPYGQVDRRFYDLLRGLFVHTGPLTLEWSADAAARLSELLDMRPPPERAPIEAANLARSGQQVYCDVTRQLLTELHQVYPSRNLGLGGGCGLNSSFNGEILGCTPFSNLHVFAAPADDGNAIGAALLAYEEDHGPRRKATRASKSPRPSMSPYLGSKPNLEKVSDLIEFGGLRPACKPEQVFEHAARLLSEGKILAWMRGRAEFGPRALGNRSILADPRDPGMKDKINARVKFREEFRPFAPSVLHEHGHEYFESYEYSPYMERAIQFRKDVMDKVPAVVHVNGSGRLQSVTRELNPDYYRLIKAFQSITGIPMLLNTSLNVMGKPIVHSVEDVVAVFFTSGIDAMVIEDFLFEKS